MKFGEAFFVGGKKDAAVDVKAMGERINELRELRGITVKEIRDVMGFASPKPIYKWINGKNLPTIDNLLIPAGMFGVKMDAAFG